MARRKSLYSIRRSRYLDILYFVRHMRMSHVMADRAAAGVVFPLLFVCPFIRTIFQKPIHAAIGSQNLAYKCSTMSSGNPFILG